MLLSEFSKIVFIRSKDFANRNIFVKKNSWWNKVKFSKVKNGNFLFVDVQNFLLLIEISAPSPSPKKNWLVFSTLFFFSVVTFFFSKTFFDDVIVWVINNCFHTFERLFKQKHLCQSKILMKQSKWWKKNLLHLSEKKACFISQKKKNCSFSQKTKACLLHLSKKKACFISQKKKACSISQKKKACLISQKKKSLLHLLEKKDLCLFLQAKTFASFFSVTNSL